MSAAPVVCVLGDEPFLVDRALAALEAEVLAGAADPGLSREAFTAPAATAASVRSAAETLPFLGGRKLVIVRDAHRWTADQWKPLLPYLEAPNPSTCLVLVAEKLDRRLKAGKAVLAAAQVVACDRPRDAELAGWVRRLAGEHGLDLDPRVVQALVLRVGPDLQLLAREVEKLRAFAGDGGSVCLEDVEALVGESRATTVFALCDALGERRMDRALGALRRLLALGEPPVRLLYMIARHFRHLRAARDLADGPGRAGPKQAAKVLGVPPFVARNVLQQAGRWERADLDGVLLRLVRADLALKSGGGREVLEQLVLGLCDPQTKRPSRGRGVGRTA